MKRYGQLAVFICLCASLTTAQDPRCPQVDNSTFISDDALFHQFFPSINYVKPVGSPQGHQNTTWCCIAAVIEYLRDGCSNTTDIQVDERILDPDEQFPCGATYANNANGAPVVRVSHSWATTYCPGWQLSQASSITQWLQTLVGFLLPSVVFALNVPRGYKFPLRDSLFAKGPLWREFCHALLAILSAILDTIFWLCIVFAMAGPLLLSGSLEAILDYNVIKYLLKKDEQRHHQHISTTDLPLALRARMLFTILGGNLELTTAWRHVMNLAQDLDGLDNPTVGSDVVGRPESDVRPLFRERIFSFDIDANDAQPSPRLDDLNHQQGKPIESHIRTESPASSETSDQEIHDGSITPAPGALPISFHRGRTMSDPLKTPRPLISMRLTDQTTGQATLNSNYLTPPPRNDLRARRRRFSEKGDINILVRSKTVEDTSSRSSNRSINEKEAQWDSIGRQYLEIYRREKRKKKTVGRIDQRLKAMLACQYSFGSTVGAPVVFYAGSFVYTLVEILQSYGDIDVSHALAFGSWWMIIPHIAILSGLLLGGNNPNTLGAIIGAKEQSKLQYAFGRTKPNSSEALNDELRHEANVIHIRESVAEGARHRNMLEPFFEHVLERVYADSIYTPVSMWDRGRSKQTWLLILCAESWTSYDWYEQKRLEAFKKELVEFVHETIMLSRVGRISVMCTTFLLLFIPCTLGTLIAYETPQVGLSCRSFTIIVYMGLQALLLVLWGLQMTYLDDYWWHGRQIVRAHKGKPQAISEQVNKAFWDLRELAHKDVIRKPKEKRYVWWQYIFHTLLLFSPVAAIFSALGGTLLQIIGVYRSSFCHFNIDEWVKHGPAMATMSTNDQQDISLARHDWLSIGTASICFLSVTCFSGWVYQKRARYSFDELAITLGEDIQKRCVELDNEGNDKTSVQEVHPK